MYDLRHHLAGRQVKFDTFWDEAKKFIEEDVGVAVDDRRHSTVLHVAKAVSVRDLREQVVSRCPEGTPVPSEEWIRLQFAPTSLSSHIALRYTGKLEVKGKYSRGKSGKVIQTPTMLHAFINTRESMHGTMLCLSALMTSI